MPTRRKPRVPKFADTENRGIGWSAGDRAPVIGRLMMKRFGRVSEAEARRASQQLVAGPSSDVGFRRRPRPGTLAG